MAPSGRSPKSGNQWDSAWISRAAFILHVSWRVNDTRRLPDSRRTLSSLFQGRQSSSRPLVMVILPFGTGSCSSSYCYSPRHVFSNFFSQTWLASFSQCPSFFILRFVLCFHSNSLSHCSSFPCSSLKLVD